MVHDNVNTSDYCALGTFALRVFSGSISTNKRVINVTLCPTDHLPLYFLAQPVFNLLDLVDIREYLIMADEILVDDHDGGWEGMEMLP
ncbi:hypothetical protein MDA_GLEAN10004599 [Myotis davidii]|uniref:Uncharacterized protein n=1 Tax=Myotis davidii TaxID=225400 RepID=L5M6Y6_MYODS|nr:hypothetical protein MDA_GLEAN10004599 [Myotis davidii]